MNSSVIGQLFFLILSIKLNRNLIYKTFNMVFLFELPLNYLPDYIIVLGALVMYSVWSAIWLQLQARIVP